MQVCVAGATGRTGRAVAEAVLAAHDLVLRSAVSRSAAGTDLGLAWGVAPIGVRVFARVADAARQRGVGVVAAGNFSLTAAMAQAAALLVAPHLPHREIIDYAAAGKRDAPSGTARELAERLATVNPTDMDVPVDRTDGHVEARAAAVAGTQIHSLRLPSFVVSTEIVFALPDERLMIRHDAGPTAMPYVTGTLLAIRAAGRRSGLIRGLDTLLLASAESASR